MLWHRDIGGGKKGGGKKGGGKKGGGREGYNDGILVM